MRAGSVQITEVLGEACRLTGGFHLSEDQIAVSRLRAFRGATNSVAELVGGRGVFRGPIFKRVYVDDPEQGEPYVSARDLVMADVRPTSFLSPRLGRLLEDLRLKAGMVLITCSGMNLGTAIWTREDLDGLVASHDLIRVCPSADKAPPGYLYSFLASRYGRASIRKQIYGGNIKHVEPHHIERIVVPRASSSVEAEVHRLAMEASRLREAAATDLLRGMALLHEHARIEPLPVTSAVMPFFVGFRSSSRLEGRFDAFFHSAYHRQARQRVLGCPVGGRAIGDIATSIVEPGRMKRNPVPASPHSVAFFGTAGLMALEPSPLYDLPAEHPRLQDYVVDQSTLLVPRSGQLSGIIGRAVLPHGDVVGGAVSEDAIRIHCRNEEEAGFLYVALRIPFGERQMKARAYGSSIPHLDVTQIGRVLVPDLGASEMRLIGALGHAVSDQRHRAVQLDRDARVLVEANITDGQP